MSVRRRGLGGRGGRDEESNKGRQKRTFRYVFFGQGCWMPGTGDNVYGGVGLSFITRVGFPPLTDDAQCTCREINFFFINFKI